MTAVPGRNRDSTSSYEVNQRGSNLVSRKRLILRQRRRARRWSAAARAYVSSTSALILLWSDLLELRGAAALRAFEDLRQEGNAPAAAGAGPAALGKLAHYPRLAPARVILQLAPRDVEAETDLGVGIHGASPTAPPGPGPSPGSASPCPSPPRPDAWSPALECPAAGSSPACPSGPSPT